MALRVELDRWATQASCVDRVRSPRCLHRFHSFHRLLLPTSELPSATGHPVILTSDLPLVSLQRTRRVAASPPSPARVSRLSAPSVPKTKRFLKSARYPWDRPETSTFANSRLHHYHEQGPTRDQIGTATPIGNEVRKRFAVLDELGSEVGYHSFSDPIPVDT
jgi:hypothetical protein